MNFDKSNLKTIRADIDKALAAVEAKHGISFKVGNIRYSANDFRAKLECVSTSDSKGNKIDPARAKFEKDAWRFDLAKASFGATFTSQGRKFTICGLNPRAKKYPVQATGPQGGRYKFPVSAMPSYVKAR